MQERLAESQDLARPLVGQPFHPIARGIGQQRCDEQIRKQRDRSRRGGRRLYDDTSLAGSVGDLEPLWSGSRHDSPDYTSGKCGGVEIAARDHRVEGALHDAEATLCLVRRECKVRGHHHGMEIDDTTFAD
jgi:hypothetical protein